MVADTLGMKDLRQWLCWRFEERDGKPTKVPYDPRTGEKAESTNPKTWTSYEKAVSECKKHGYDGLGFVFTPEDDLCGVDLDKCLDPETGELEGWAQKIIGELDSYTEISSSGTGVHILVRGELPTGRNRKGRFEAYDRGRYFTVTGKHLAGSSQRIENRQEELRAVVRRVFGDESTNGHTKPVAASRPVNNGLSDDEVIPSVERRHARVWQSLGGRPGAVWDAGVLDRGRRCEGRHSVSTVRALPREMGPQGLPQQDHNGSSKRQDGVLQGPQNSEARGRHGAQDGGEGGAPQPSGPAHRVRPRGRAGAIRGPAQGSARPDRRRARAANEPLLLVAQAPHVGRGGALRERRVPQDGCRYALGTRRILRRVERTVYPRSLAPRHTLLRAQARQGGAGRPRRLDLRGESSCSI